MKTTRTHLAFFLALLCERFVQLKQGGAKTKKLTLITITLLLFAVQAHAQMVVEWQSPEGITPATLGLEIDDMANYGFDRFDFNGDGILDIPVFNRLQGDDQFGVISGNDPNTTWQFPLTGVNFVKGQTTLIGFFDVDNANGKEKEVILATKSSSAQTAREAAAVINQSGLVIQYSESDLLLGIADYDKDNELEILIGDTTVPVFTLWGKGN